MSFPRFNSAADGAIRPGFDVLLAVTGARQSASATAQRVAANHSVAIDPAGADQRRQLLAHGRLAPGMAPTTVARFADVAPIAAPDAQAVDVLATEINGLFTRAFQPMVKHRDVEPADKVGRIGGADSGMK